MDRKEEVKEARKALKEDGVIKFFFGDFVDYIKEQPLKAIGTFFSYAIIFYLAMSALQALTFDAAYCDASIDIYDGKLMRVHNDFVKMVNEKNKEFQSCMEGKNTLNIDLESPDFKFDDNKEYFNQIGCTQDSYNMTCDYDVKRWFSDIRKGESDFLFNFKKVVLKE